MLLYLIKIIALSIVLFIINRVVLKMLLSGISDDKLTKSSIVLTGIVSILIIILSCGRVEGFESEESEPTVTDGGDIQRDLEEAPNAEIKAQEDELEQNVEDNLQELLNKLQEKEEETKASLDVTEPRPSTNSSVVITEGISGQKAAIEETKKMADRQITVEKSAEPEPMPQKQTPRPQQDLEEIQNKYTILPIDQWVRPDAVDIIKAKGCMCPNYTAFGVNAMEYN